ncbi:ATP-binding protein [Emcibacter sp.]|uniref:ATP-binding protein n=1 Tax=Emcibacter sp. TaxID=1979954 RepID=UPI003A8F6B4D
MNGLLNEKQTEQLSKLALELSQEIGFVTEVSGNGVVALCAVEALNRSLEKDDSTLPPGQIGAIVKIKVIKGFVYATVREVVRQENSTGPVQHVIMYLDYLGHGIKAPYSPTGVMFDRGISDFPCPGQMVYETTLEDIESIFGANDMNHFHVGTVFPQHVTQASIMTDAMLGKHFAVLGSTGTGKSCTVALLIHRLVERMPNGHIIMLDPHNEYEAAFKDCGEHFDINNLRLPYWMMNFEEHVELFVGLRRSLDREVEIDILRRCLQAARIDAAETMSSEKITVDTPIPYKLSFMLKYLENEMGRLENPDTLTPYMRLKNKIEELRRDARFSFMFSGLLANDNLSEVIGNLLRFPVNGKPVSTIDLSGVPSEIVNVVVSMISRLVFDFALWSKGGDAKPILLVCEEAHRYVPTEDHTVFASTRKAIEQIAKEGRKYGVSLGLVSQRPADVSESALSQCGTIFAMRMNNERDQNFVSHVMPEGAKGSLAALSSLQNREALIVGEGVRAPVRVKFDSLDESKRPSSTNPAYSSDWQNDISNQTFINDAIKHWRSQGR